MLYRAAVVCLGILALSVTLRAADATVDDEGFIRNWLLLAPIPLEQENNGAEEIDKQQIKDEGTLKPKAGDKVKVGQKELAWKEVAIKDYFFDVAVILGNQTEQATAYAVAYVEAAEEIKGVQVAMGSNDQGKVYLNGKEVVKFTDTRTIDKDQDVAKGQVLNKGVNVVVFKVINQQNDFQGCLRFKDADGKPIKGLKVKN